MFVLCTYYVHNFVMYKMSCMTTVRSGWIASKSVTIARHGHSIKTEKLQAHVYNNMCRQNHGIQI